MVAQWSAHLAHLLKLVEMYALFLARFVWWGFISAVLYSFIKGSSASSHFRKLLAASSSVTQDPNS